MDYEIFRLGPTLKIGLQLSGTKWLVGCEVISRVLITRACLVQWLSWVFTPREEQNELWIMEYSD